MDRCHDELLYRALKMGLLEDCEGPPFLEWVWMDPAWSTRNSPCGFQPSGRNRAGNMARVWM